MITKHGVCLKSNSQSFSAPDSYMANTILISITRNKAAFYMWNQLSDCKEKK